MKGGPGGWECAVFNYASKKIISLRVGCPDVQFELSIRGPSDLRHAGEWE